MATSLFREHRVRFPALPGHLLGSQVPTIYSDDTRGTWELFKHTISFYFLKNAMRRNCYHSGFTDEGREPQSG